MGHEFKSRRVLKFELLSFLLYTSIVEDKTLITLRTGKPHISFSELREWKECSYRHKLKHIDGLDKSSPSPHADFGKAVHSACENFLKTREMNIGLALDSIKELWALEQHVDTHKDLESFLTEAVNILNDIPSFMEEKFPNWEFVDAEHQLYEQIADMPHAFKGFIDAIITTKDKKGKTTFWLLDWKTTSWGWSSAKKSDDLVKMQLVLYKNFWSLKTNTNLKDVKCGFILLKRTAKQGAHCELVTTSVGPVVIERANKAIRSMITSINRGVTIKNRSNCTYCQFKNSEHCI